MRPTFMGFETARKGLAVNQKGLDIVGHNIMNLQTEGYTRQRIDVRAVGLDSYSSRYGVSRTDLSGQGVDASGVSQIRDSFLDKRFREEYSDVGYYDTTSGLLGDIEKVLNEFGLNPAEDNPNGTGLENAIKEITKSLGSFSSEGDSKTHATILMTSFKNMTQLLNQFDSKLNSVADQAKFDLKVSMDELNVTLSKIADLNYQIEQDMAVTKSTNGEYYGPNELMDQRNMLLDKLANYGDLKVEPQSNGTVTVNMNGKKVVEGSNKEMINLSYNNNGTVALNWQSDGTLVNLTTGALKAFTDVINGRGVNAQLTNEVNYNGIRYYRDKINGFANTLAKTVNNIIPQQKLDANGKPIKPAEPALGKYRPLLQSTVYEKQDDGTVTTRTDLPVTAANITISDEWAKDSTLIVFEEGNLDNKYILQMKEALTTGTYNFRASGDIGDSSFNGTFVDYIEDYTVSQAGQKQDSDSRLKASVEISGDLIDRRDDVSGVSQDEETVNMMMYQKAYQAAARLMTTIDEALDKLINSTGLVGR
ncbi:MAG: flagellar hook-associated protein FlgK [Oscillospiraceae bacterium]